MTRETDAVPEGDPPAATRQSDGSAPAGLPERYPRRLRLWLVVGGLVSTAALLTQIGYFYHQSLPEWVYAGIWTGFVVSAVVAERWEERRAAGTESVRAGLDWHALFGAVVAFVLALVLASRPVVTANGALDRATFYFALVVAAVGLGLGLTGVVLRGYPVGARARRVFYAGGAWTLGYAVLMPYARILRFVGVGVFGLLFLLYTVASYVYLTRQ